MIRVRENGRLSVRSLDLTQSKRSLHLLRNNEGCREHLNCKKSRAFRLSQRLSDSRQRAQNGVY